MRERLQKILAGSGLTSRRGAEAMIRAGRISVNGLPAELGQRADPDEDQIRIDGRLLPGGAPRLYIALHKPLGYVTSLRSTHGEPTVRQLINLERRIHPVGRLDRETSGLLLLTDDGCWTNLVAHPRYGIEKEYSVVVRGKPADAVLQHVATGVVLPDGHRTAPAKVSRIGLEGNDTSLTMTMVEGKKRQIRLMWRSVGHDVIHLRRDAIGRVKLGDLEVGHWRELHDWEVQSVREEARRGSAKSGSRSQTSDCD
jgi:23S rRNA pseudouridine2605 synthase